MRKSAHALVVAAVCSTTLLLNPGVAAADGVTDMRLGNFFAIWCNYDAHLNVESRDGDSWVFHGHIQIDRTGQVDELFVEQYEDNSLRIVRYLSGPEAGQVQTIQTHPPQVKMIGGRQTAEFDSKNSYGVGCEYTKNSSVWL